MKTKEFNEVVTRLFGPKQEFPEMKRVSREFDIWGMGILHKHAVEAHLAAEKAKDMAYATYQAAANTAQKTYANLAEIEIELDAMEKEVGLVDATRFYTLEVESDDEGEEHA